MNGDKPINGLKGIGDSRGKAFARLGLNTLEDLISFYPRAYQNRGDTLTLQQIRERLEEGEEGPFASILTVVAEPGMKMIRRGMTVIKVRLFDEDSTCEVTFFNQPYLKDILHTGAAFRVWGRFRLERGRVTASSPIMEPYTEGRYLAPIVPVYPLTSGLKQKIVSTAVGEALRLCLPETAEYLPVEILSECSLPTTAYALKNIHQPESEAALKAAQRRLIFDELFISSVALSVAGGKKKTSSNARIKDTDITEFLSVLPYRLTSAQERAVEEIISDMSGEYSMNRILTGDVGSGKTVVAEAAAYIAMKNGYDVMLMAPTEILATQHYADLKPQLGALGFNVLLLTGSTGKRERLHISESLMSVNPCMVIGTHALLNEKINSDKLGLVITDEQHRFGALQRAALSGKADGINTLVMSATPIPRTLSLIVYGNLDVSRIDELPAGRKPIDTFVVDSGYEDRLIEFIKKQAAEGHQTYIVCPSIDEVKKEIIDTDNLEEAANLFLFDTEEDDELPMKAATEYAEYLAERMTDLNVALVHGKMKSREKDEVMERFCRGDYQVLVSTTVIEVGVNVPTATLMIVENAERFGLSQLHQLRGRVGRGDAKSYFVLVSDSKSQKSKERLLTLKNNRSGFAIAEADLKQRGPGDLFAEGGVIRQHGESSLSLAASCTDIELIEKVSALAEKLLRQDPTLERAENRELRLRAEKLIRKNENTVN